MNEKMVSFEFPRELVKKFHDTNSPDYWWGLFCDDDFNAKTKLECLLYTRVLEWQETHRLEVTADTPPGTEVEITDPDYRPKPLYRSEPNYRTWLVGPDPRAGGAVVDDELQGYLHVEWEHLRLVEPLTEGDNE